MLCGSVVNYITGIREWYQFEKKDSTNLSYVKNGKSTAVLSETLHKNRLLKIAEKRFSAIFLIKFPSSYLFPLFRFTSLMIFSARFRVLIFGLFKRRYALEISVFFHMDDPLSSLIVVMLKNTNRNNYDLCFKWYQKLK